MNDSESDFSPAEGGLGLRIRIGVRQLVEFTLRSGDLVGGGDFVGPNRALEGTRGHQRLQRSRPPGYQAEVLLVRHEVRRDMTMIVNGRVDGVLEEDAGDERSGTSLPLIEEIKTFYGPDRPGRDPVHWGQARMYGYLYAESRESNAVQIQLTYLDLISGNTVVYRETLMREDLRQFASGVLAEYEVWAREELAWQQRRDHAIARLPFAFPSFRPGQRELAVAAYRSLKGERHLFAEAPTGIGKTIAVLFPSIKAIAAGIVERIYYLTATRVGRRAAEAALDRLRDVGLTVRHVTLAARDSVCRDAQGAPCDPRRCPLALGYYDRLKPALREALNRAHLPGTDLDAFARARCLCPFAFALDVSTWSEIVVGDYNHAFDPGSHLKRHFGGDAVASAFLIDEAHNLVERARDMHSADLDQNSLRITRNGIKAFDPRVAKSLTSVLRQFNRITRNPAGAVGMEQMEGNSDPPTESDEALVQSHLFDREPEIPGAPTEGASDAGLAPLNRALRRFMTAAEKCLILDRAGASRETLRDTYFNAHHFVRVSEQYDGRYATLIDGPDRHRRLRLACLDPSKALRQALGRCRSACFFSGTLTPPEFYRNMLGGGADDRLLRVNSPFPPENLEVLIADRIATRFNARTASGDQVARSIGAFVSARTGNYLVFFPSFRYLEHIHELYRDLFPDAACVRQSSGMSDEERARFTAAFEENPSRTMVGWAVMGGLFGEGIDLAGDRLVGAAIVGVGLPQLTEERNRIREYFDGRDGVGFEYAYMYPGWNRVLQAVGRVIRSEREKGMALLIDERFGAARYRRFFPPSWNPRRVRSAADISEHCARFWGERSG